MAKWPYNGPWPRIRLEILERDGHACQIQGKGCTGKATQVDHIVPVESGGAPYDHANLRASCRRCNVARRNRSQAREGWRNASTRITLVCGPPGAGKSTYVAQHKRDGDMVVDYDAIGDALGTSRDTRQDQTHEVVNAARNAVLRKIRGGDTGAPHVWIISTNPRAESLFPHHEMIELDPGIDEVRRRIQARGDVKTLGVAENWYVTRTTPAPDDTTTPTPSRNW